MVTRLGFDLPPASARNLGRSGGELLTLFDQLAKMTAKDGATKSAPAATGVTEDNDGVPSVSASKSDPNDLSDVSDPLSVFDSSANINVGLNGMFVLINGRISDQFATEEPQLQSDRISSDAAMLAFKEFCSLRGLTFDAQGDVIVEGAVLHKPRTDGAAGKDKVAEDLARGITHSTFGLAAY